MYEEIARRLVREYCREWHPVSELPEEGRVVLVLSPGLIAPFNEVYVRGTWWWIYDSRSACARPCIGAVAPNSLWCYRPDNGVKFRMPEAPVISPCPLCGGDRVLYGATGSWGWKCRNCACNARAAGFGTQEAAIEAANRRTG